MSGGDEPEVPSCALRSDLENAPIDSSTSVASSSSQMYEDLARPCDKLFDNSHMSQAAVA